MKCKFAEGRLSTGEKKLSLTPPQPFFKSKIFGNPWIHCTACGTQKVCSVGCKLVLGARTTNTSLVSICVWHLWYQEMLEWAWQHISTQDEFVRQEQSLKATRPMLKSPPDCAYSLSWAHPQLGAASGVFWHRLRLWQTSLLPLSSLQLSRSKNRTVSKEMLMSCDECRMLDSATTTRSFRDKWSTLSGFQIWGSLSRPTTRCSAKEELSNRFFPKSCRCRRWSVHLQKIPK